MNEQLSENLRNALNNFYEPEQLRMNPLTRALGLADRLDASLAMQKALEQLINALQPKHDDPGRSKKRKMYNLLYSRYIDRFSQREVANQLGISLRSYQREQKMALAFLTNLLAEKYPELQTTQGEPEGDSNQESENFRKLDEEFSWMFKPAAPTTASLEDAISSALQLSQPLMKQYQVEIQSYPVMNRDKVSIHPHALLQIILNILLPAAHLTTNGKVRLTTNGDQANITLECSGSQLSRTVTGEQRLEGGPVELSSADRSSLDIARHLAQIAGGRLETRTTADNFVISVILPIFKPLPILVIDDNPDNIKLMQRFLDDTRYQVNSISQPELAIAKAEGLRPQVIILDLMMPGIDGLEILTQLRLNPLTNHIPIVVCTILPQEELVLSLGASGFLRKPVSRENLLTTLNRLCAEQV